MAENPILHRDGLLSSTCRIGLYPKGCGGSTARDCRLAGDLFCMDEKQIKELEFHIQLNDYFSTSAAVLEVMQEALNTNTKEAEKIRLKYQKILSQLREELVYLQENYKIVRK